MAKITPCPMLCGDDRQIETGARTLASDGDSAAPVFDLLWLPGADTTEDASLVVDEVQGPSSSRGSLRRHPHRNAPPAEAAAETAESASDGRAALWAGGARAGVRVDAVRQHLMPVALIQRCMAAGTAGRATFDSVYRLPRRQRGQRGPALRCKRSTLWARKPARVQSHRQAAPVSKRHAHSGAGVSAGGGGFQAVRRHRRGPRVFVAGRHGLHAALGRRKWE